jgi:nucleotide-binding universal stress UspA family protein
MRMTTIHILGVEGSSKTISLRANVQAALEELGMEVIVKNVTSVDDLMNYNINGIPALVVNGTVVLQKVVPEVEDLKILLQVFKGLFSEHLAMKNFLVPTDFSNVSKDAYLFARQLARLEDGELKVVNIYHPDYDPQSPYLTEPMLDMVAAKKERLASFVLVKNGNLDDDFEGRVSHDIVVGFPVEEILRLSKTGKTDMIVMGTTGEKGILEQLFGSVSINVAQKSSCPVMLVPGGVQFKGFKHVLFASDYESATITTLKQLIDFTKKFKADVHFVHVENEKSAKTYNEIENRLFKILFNGGEPKFSFTMSKVEGESIVAGINDYAVSHSIDLVVMVHPRRTFWDSVFHKSVTKEMALNTKIPILILPG